MEGSLSSSLPFGRGGGQVDTSQMTTIINSKYQSYHCHFSADLVLTLLVFKSKSPMVADHRSARYDDKRELIFIFVEEFLDVIAIRFERSNPS